MGDRKLFGELLCSGPLLYFWLCGLLSELCWWLQIMVWLTQVWLAQIGTEQHCLGPASIRSPQAPEEVS